ncbi:hypothetical protein BJ165DRAFT_1505553 [Panaeolus papilionaceus]|nr:hypothetical protein BJ165DRAFT_1505553 [Panaeolus papilionaceus]
MKDAEEVAVFWDYENCPVPTNVSGYAAVNHIRSLAHPYGSVKVFRAYLGLSDHPILQNVKSQNTRSELQVSGVSLIDCPHNGRKEVADKMIIGTSNF